MTLQRWKRIAVVAMLWQVLVVPVFYIDYAWFDLGWKINRLQWKLIGPPDNIYGYWNLGLPRHLAWCLISIPPYLISVLIYER